jgi:hypothetical protein
VGRRDERRSFRDGRLQRRFRRDGYVVVDLAPPEVIRGLRDVYERHDSGIDSGYYASMHSASVSYKAGVDRELRPILWPCLDRYLLDYEPLGGAFMVKHPGPDTAVPPHQDWRVADPGAGPAVNSWIPVTDVDEATGQMAVLPGSHRTFDCLQGSPGFPAPWQACHERVRDELMVTVPVAVGQALLLDNRLVHGTPPHGGSGVRIVAYVDCVPAGAEWQHWYLSPEGTAEGYRVGPGFYTEGRFGERPDGELIERIEGYGVASLSFEEIRSRHARRPRR